MTASVAQLAARGSHNPKVVGSTPTGGMFLHPTRALVAQLAALRSYEPMVQGSSPCRSIFCPSQCGWMAEWSKALVLGTSLFGGVGSNPTPVTLQWGISSIGRVRRSQRRGTGIETRILHLFGFAHGGRVGSISFRLGTELGSGAVGPRLAPGAGSPYHCAPLV